jgi:CheY-like chemotaxis protein
VRRPTTVLVVEDDSAIRQLILEALSGDGYAVEGAADAPAALQAIRRQRPDLIVTDYHLPGSDGLELLRALRHEGFSDVPALVVSADSRPPEWPATSFIPKPFELDSILRAVRRALGLGVASDEPGSGLGPALASVLCPPAELGFA